MYKMRLLDSVIYNSERLACTNQEKDACLQTVKKLARLWDEIRREGVLVVLSWAETEEDAFFRTCLLEFGEGYTPAALEQLFAAYLAAGDYRGGAFLNAVLSVKGLLLLSQQIHNNPDINAGIWGKQLAAELRGFFGAEYRERVLAAIEQETRRQTQRTVSVVPAFDQIAQLPLAQRQNLLQDMEARILAIALQGAGAAVENALLEALDAREREMLEQVRPFLTNLRKKDVVQAQTQILEKKGT